MAIRPRTLSPSEVVVDAPLLVGFSGLAKSGKDTAAKAIASTIGTLYGTKCEMLSFAEPIREIGKVFGYTDEQMGNQELKETYLGNKITNVTPRKFMQVVGTDMFRNCLDKDIWVRMLESKVTETLHPSHMRYLEQGSSWRPSKVYFITDVRFPNEADAIRKRKGIVIRVDREQTPKASGEWRKHESEKMMSEITPDYVWENNANSALFWCCKSLNLFEEAMKDKNITFQ